MRSAEFRRGLAVKAAASFIHLFIHLSTHAFIYSTDKLICALAQGTGEPDTGDRSQPPRSLLPSVDKRNELAKK